MISDNACRSIILAVVAAVMPSLAHAASSEAAPLKAAVFDFELIDETLEGKQEDEVLRLSAIADRMRAMLAERGIEVVDTGPVRDKVQAVILRSCNGCERGFARELGADLVVIGHVQKVSNLILSINVMVRDVESGAVIRGGSVDIRGNTDESWLRGVSHLTRNRLLAPPLQGTSR